MSSATFYKWRAKYGGMDASMMARLKELEDENRRLKNMYAEERLKAEMIQDAMKKVVRPSQRREMAKDWLDDAKRGMENALKARPEDIREQYERQLKELQEAYGEAMLELRARKKLESLLGKDES